MTDNRQYIRLSEWARRKGMHRHTAWRHYTAGTLSAALRPIKFGGIVYVRDNPDQRDGRIVGYARVSSSEQRPQLEPQANRLWAYAGQNGIILDGVITETASGLNDRRPKLLSGNCWPTRRLAASWWNTGKGSPALAPVWLTLCSKPAAAGCW